jgi:hypothetical protein
MTLDPHEKEALREILLHLAGHASMCWSHVEGAGVFQSDKAERAVEIALQKIESLR